MVIRIPDTSSKKNLRTWIFTTLSNLNIKLRKKLSQVFLINPEILHYIAYQVKEEIGTSNPTVVEVGAGLGTLTKVLVENCSTCYLIAIEIDKRFLPILSLLQRTYPQLDIILSDALFILEKLRSIDAVVGNLPYHITSELLVSLGRSNARIAIITIQKDVAQRLLAKPGSKNYGKISIYIQSLFNVEILRTVSATNFKPEPEVDSAIVLLRRIREYNDIIAIMEKLLKCMFSYKRKLVSKALKRCIDKNTMNQLIKFSDVKWASKRVYQLSVEEVLEIASIYASLVEK